MMWPRPVMAPFGLGAMSELSPLSGVELKSDFGAVWAAVDPRRTSVAFLGRNLSASSKRNGVRPVVRLRDSSMTRVSISLDFDIRSLDYGPPSSDLVAHIFGCLLDRTAEDFCR
jgi:hypothetical protein